jgi:hypothetical protein
VRQLTRDLKYKDIMRARFPRSKRRNIKEIQVSVNRMRMWLGN